MRAEDLSLSEGNQKPSDVAYSRGEKNQATFLMGGEG